jgi:hypothetical protein
MSNREFVGLQHFVQLPTLRANGILSTYRTNRMLSSSLHVRQGVWGKVDRPWHRDGQCRQQKQYGITSPNGHGPTSPTTPPLRASRSKYHGKGVESATRQPPTGLHASSVNREGAVSAGQSASNTVAMQRRWLGAVSCRWHLCNLWGILVCT